MENNHYYCRQGQFFCGSNRRIISNFSILNEHIPHSSTKSSNFRSFVQLNLFKRLLLKRFKVKKCVFLWNFTSLDNKNFTTNVMIVFVIIKWIIGLLMIIIIRVYRFYGCLNDYMPILYRLLTTIAYMRYSTHFI